MTAAKPLRQAMPQTAAFIDFARQVFGAPAVDAAIRAGLAGQPTFHADEAGQRIGTPPPAAGARFTVDQLRLADFPSIPDAGRPRPRPAATRRGKART